MNVWARTKSHQHKQPRPGLRVAIALCLFACSLVAAAQQTTYKNPILFADYSDPDVIRDGNDFYLIASSFHFSPGLPILHSTDLVHWEISGHALPRLTFSPAYDMQAPMRYGGGVWAPSVRFHNGLFYIYFPTPDEGIFVTTAPKMTGPWSAPTVVIAGPGLEDPCPLWDDDGKAYLVHSRLHAGPLILHRLAPDGLSVLDAGKTIVEDPKNLPTLEGPKFYKRNGWYYIFAPMGGVGTGSQAVLRSRNIYGPYDHRIVLSQGQTKVNGPHQGGYVETPDGHGFFLHFQLHASHGRIVYLEPVTWVDDWPRIGHPIDGTLIGQPVEQGTVPLAPNPLTPATSDEFSSRTLAPQWEWNHNPDDALWSLTDHPGYLRLHPSSSPDLLHARNTLTESMQDEAFELTTRLDIRHLQNGDRVGLTIFDKGLTYIGIQRKADRSYLTLRDGDTTDPLPSTLTTLQLRARITGDHARYAYSLDDGLTFKPLGDSTTLVFSWWKGARPGLFAFTSEPHPSPNHYVDFDWVHYRALPPSTRD